MSATTHRIGRASPAEVDQIGQLSRDLIEVGLPWRWHPARLRALTRSSAHLVIAARELEGALAGFVVLELHPGDTERAHLVLLAVVPGVQRRGLGRRLVDWVERCAREAGAAAIDLEVRADNDGARRFYTALGYREEALLRGYYNGQIDALRLTRQLRPLQTEPIEWDALRPLLGL